MTERTINFAPRTREIYIAADVHWCLRMVVKSLNGKQSQLETGFNVDQLADDLLRQYCREKWPTVMEARQRRDAIDAEIVESLKGTGTRKEPIHDR